MTFWSGSEVQRALEVRKLRAQLASVVSAMQDALSRLEEIQHGLHEVDVEADKEEGDQNANT